MLSSGPWLFCSIGTSSPVDTWVPCDVRSSSGFQGCCGLALLPCARTSCPWQLCVFLRAGFIAYTAVLRWPCDPGGHPVRWVGPGYASRPLPAAWASSVCAQPAPCLACPPGTVAPSSRRCFVFSGLMRNACPVVRPRFVGFLPLPHELAAVLCCFLWSPSPASVASPQCPA